MGNTKSRILALLCAAGLLCGASPLAAQVGSTTISISGGPFGGAMLAPTGCTSPPFSFTADGTAGLCLAAANDVQLVTGAGTAQTPIFRLYGDAALSTFLSFTNVATPTKIVDLYQRTSGSWPYLLISARDAGTGESTLRLQAGDSTNGISTTQGTDIASILAATDGARVNLSAGDGTNSGGFDVEPTALTASVTDGTASSAGSQTPSFYAMTTDTGAGQLVVLTLDAANDQLASLVSVAPTVSYSVSMDTDNAMVAVTADTATNDSRLVVGPGYLSLQADMDDNGVGFIGLNAEHVRNTQSGLETRRYQDTKTFVDEVKLDLALVGLGDNGHLGGTFTYSAISVASGDIQAVAGLAVFACYNEADTEACTLTMQAAEAAVAEAGTLACTPAIDVDETNAVMFNVTCNQEAGDAGGTFDWVIEFLSPIASVTRQ